MAMVTAMLPIFLSLVSHYLIIANGVHSLEERMMFNVQMLQEKQQLHTRGCLLPESRWEKGAVVLEMKDRAHCSEKKIDWNKRLHKQLALDDLRVRSMQSKIQKMFSTQSSGPSSQAHIPLASGVNLLTANYIVAVGLGSQKMVLIVDTGSDLTWVQCQPCTSCYNQELPVFNPSTSSSYQSIMCNSTACQYLESNDPEACSSNPSTCSYVVEYDDGSYTHGQLGAENLILGDISVSNFVFGCGRDNKGLFGTTSGVIGLGRGKLSLVSQTSDTTLGGVFSYCFPPVTANGATGSLVFGNEFSLFKNVTPISYTKMVHNPKLPDSYLLNLIGMKVGDVDLQVPSFGTGGVLIDSGTMITRLAPSIYNALKEQFLRQFSDYPRAPGFGILDTCFDLSGYEQVRVPIIRMYFEGNAELAVDVNGMLVILRAGGSQVCLAIASLPDENGISIIGHYLQTNQRVIYDTKQSVVGFARETCSYD